MTQPKLFFQGFEGARQVQSMMIDFPELRFYLELENHGENKQGDISWIQTVTIDHTKPRGYNRPNYYNNLDYVFVVSFLIRHRTLGSVTRYTDFDKNCTYKIFVAPESEGFFDALNGDEYIMDRKPYPLHIGGCPDFRNGKRIWMPQTL